MQWQKITERCECVSVDETLCAVYHLGGNDVVIMDAGGGVVEEFIEDIVSRGLNVRALLLSHLHFDHCSMAGHLWDIFKMPSYVAGNERHEVWFPVKFFPATRLKDETEILIDGQRFEVIRTPGHCKGHLAFVTPDNVCYVGDVMMSDEPLKRSKIPYMMDVEQSLASMELIRRTNCRAYVLSHEAVVMPEDLDLLIDRNIEKELLLYDELKALVTEPVYCEELITDFMKHCGIRNSFILGYRAYRDTVRSRLLALEYAGELEIDGPWIMPGSKG